MSALQRFPAQFARLARLINVAPGYAKLLGLLLIVLAIWLVYILLAPRNEPTTAHWSAIDVSGDSHSGDAHLIEFDNGDVILIDTGYAAYARTEVIPYLKQRGIVHIDVILITHAHLNHYGGLLDIVQNFSVGKVFFNEPDEAVCRSESKRDRCNLGHVREQLQQVSELTQVLPVRSNDTLYQAGSTELRVKHVSMAKSELSDVPQDATQTQFTVNESSVVSQLTLGEMSVLFPGDIGPIVGEYLVASTGDALRSTLLAAPHHGVTPMPSPKFFERVAPQVIVASISKVPYVGERGQPLREFAKANNIPLYVSGYVGTVQTELRSDSFRVLNQ